ncbi:MAG: hypothetical protein Q9169_004790 [Polycauliona sp. 2 TL-2023]
MPSRVIVVGHPDSSHSPYLRDSRSLRKAPYITLSHCWNASQDLTTPTLVSGNLEQMQRLISFEQLPRSFRDAVMITRALNIRYLWIDALCIIQDSPADRAVEYARKLDYFSNSWLNIAATAAASLRQGILGPRYIASVSTELSGQSEGLGIRHVSDFIQVKKFLPARPPLSNQPSDSHAHAFLERICAKRTIHLTEQQMVWQCSTCFLGEDGQIGEHLDYFYESTRCSGPLDFHLKPPLREITAANENEHHRYPEFTLSSPVVGHTGVRYSMDEALMDTRWYDFIQQYTHHPVQIPSLVLQDKERRGVERLPFLELVICAWQD